MFQLVFKGECVPGVDQETARSNARALFKASVDQLDRMFSGQPVVIRNKLEQVQAEKYLAVLRKHGMVAQIQPMPGAAMPEKAEAKARPVAAQAPAGAPATVGPGSSYRPAAAGRPVDGRVPETEPGQRLALAGDKVDGILAGSGLALDPVGVTLAEHKEADTPMFEHLDDWTLAPPGTDLGSDRKSAPTVEPDTSHLSLADEEAPPARS